MTAEKENGKIFKIQIAGGLKKDKQKDYNARKKSANETTSLLKKLNNLVILTKLFIFSANSSLYSILYKP